MSDRNVGFRGGDGTGGDAEGGIPGGDRDGDEPPRVLAVAGRFGIYLAVASLAAAVFGVVALYVGFQPYGNVALTSSRA